jgi:hypothetical protein
MKKDIVFPVVKDVYIAIVKEWNKDFTSHDWIVYLINDTSTTLESAMVMSRGQHKDGRKTSTFRHAFKEVAAKTAIKVELIMEEVFAFKNEFVLTYFIGATLYDHVYTAAPYSINQEAVTRLPVINQEGVLLK